MSLLQLENINKTYSQGTIDVPALNHINLVIEQGEYVAIMGPSGSGKSTLMNIIGCLDKPTEGKLYLNGNDIGAMNDRKLSDIRNKEIGFVFQNFNLMPRQSALQNVELPLQYAHIPKRQRRPLCEEALIKVGLEDRMSFKATQLSGGQKQRVAIARAIVNNPSILLADEPTGALDSKSGIQVMNIFKQLHNEGSTIIMITHAEEIARHANRIIKIFDGEITSDYINEDVISIVNIGVEPEAEAVSEAEAINEAEVNIENNNNVEDNNVVSDTISDIETETVNDIQTETVETFDPINDTINDPNIDPDIDEEINLNVNDEVEINLRDEINTINNSTYADNDIELSEGGVTV